jgi:hypothetical protein
MFVWNVPLGCVSKRYAGVAVGNATRKFGPGEKRREILARSIQHGLTRCIVPTYRKYLDGNCNKLSKERGMSDSSAHPLVSDPLHKLARNLFCEEPPDQLSVEQLCALHEFFHEVLAAGYRLYQVVPAAKAAAVMKTKFGMMFEALPPPDPNAAPSAP